MNIQTTVGVLDRSLVTRERILVDDDRERTINLEYRLKQPLELPDGRRITRDEVIKRSAHVGLKQWPAGLEAAFWRSITESFPLAQRLPDLYPYDRYQVMNANVQAMCTSFKTELLNGSHAFGTQGANAVRTVTTKDTFKIALFLVSGSRGAADTVYNTTGELAGTGNYTQGGAAVTNATVPAATGTTAFWTPSASVSWGPTFTSSAAFDAAVLYNDASTSKLEVAVFTFGSQSIASGTFTLTMPTNDSSTGLIRIA